MFTDCQLKSFIEYGFVIMKEFFTPSEVKIMQVETNRLLKAGKFRNVTTEEDAKEHSSKRNLQLIPLYEHSKIYRFIPF